MKYFDFEEFECKCGCGKMNMQSRVLDALDFARGQANIPFKIDSGCRCTDHNSNVGGVDSSSHVDGWAADIYVPNNQARFKILKALVDVGCERIGVGKTFIHCDWDPTKPAPRMWNY